MESEGNIHNISLFLLYHKANRTAIIWVSFMTTHVGCPTKLSHLQGPCSKILLSYRVSTKMYACTLHKVRFFCYSLYTKILWFASCTKDRSYIFKIVPSLRSFIYLTGCPLKCMLALCTRFASFITVCIQRFYGSHPAQKSLLHIQNSSSRSFIILQGVH